MLRVFYLSTPEPLFLAVEPLPDLTLYSQLQSDPLWHGFGKEVREHAFISLAAHQELENKWKLQTGPGIADRSPQSMESKYWASGSSKMTYSVIKIWLLEHGGKICNILNKMNKTVPASLGCRFSFPCRLPIGLHSSQVSLHKSLYTFSIKVELVEGNSACLGE